MNLLRYFCRALLAAATVGAVDPSGAPAASLDDPLALERAMSREPLVLLDSAGARAADDRTRRAWIDDPELGAIQVKIKPAAPGADNFNNQPRYSRATYELQKLFLDPEDYVVPPTVIRVMGLDEARAFVLQSTPTFSPAHSVVVVLQYWLPDVAVFDELPDHVSDPVMVRSLASANLLTYLIAHADSNRGNLLISTDPEDGRVFAVDNDIAYGSTSSDRGTHWRKLRVSRLPKSAVDRLRGITREDLTARLAIVAQFRRDGERLVPDKPASPFQRSRGVRRRGDVVQLGLTQREIVNVYRRIRSLLEQVDAGKIELADW